MTKIAVEKTHLALIAVVAIVAIAGLAVMFKSADVQDVQTQPTIIIVQEDSKVNSFESEDLTGAITVSNRTASR